MTVETILAHKGSDIICATVDMTIQDVAQLLGEKRIGAVLVKDGGSIAGIISERDIVRGLAIRGAESLSQSVTELMTKNVITCVKESSVQQVMQMMTERRIRHLPVMEGDTLLGLITIGDVVNARVQETEQEAEALKDYIAHG